MVFYFVVVVFVLGVDLLVFYLFVCVRKSRLGRELD